jgi:hypothetical protein
MLSCQFYHKFLTAEDKNKLLQQAPEKGLLSTVSLLVLPASASNLHSRKE